MSTALADQLQVWGFDRDFIVFSDGSLGFGLDVTPIDVSCFSEEDMNGFATKVGHFLNGLPPHIDVQFVQDIEGGADEILAKYQELNQTQDAPLVNYLVADRIKFLKAQDESGSMPRHTLKVFVRRSLSKVIFERPSVFKKEKLFVETGQENFESEMRLTESLRDEMISALEGLGLHSTNLSVSSLYALMYWQWNPARPIGPGNFDADDLRSSVVFTDAMIYEKGFTLGDVHHRLVSLKLFPDYTVSTTGKILRDLPFGTRTFLSVHVPDQQRELEKLQTQRRIAFSMARGKKTGVSDIDSEAKLVDIEELLNNLITQGEKVFHMSLNVLLRSQNKDELDYQVGQVLSVFREMNGSEGMEESLASFDIYKELAIPHTRARERAKSIKTSNLKDLVPIYGPWAGHEKPSVLLKTRHGSLLKFDPFDSSLTNYNQIVSGGSGSGKSFATNLILFQMLKEQPKIFVVDIGGSYKKLCETLNGQYIPLGVNSGSSFNPFDLLENETRPSNDKVKFLVGLIEIMTKEDDENRVGRLERAELENAIQSVYEKGPTPHLSDLRNVLKSHSDQSISRFGRILSAWCGDSPFGQFVDRPTSIALNKSIVCFDLKGLEALPDLQAACLFIITDFIWREVQRDRSTRKFIVFDECWRLLESESGSQFIGEVFRTLRKYYGSAIAISQNLDDFAKSRVSNAILTNASVKWILMQKGADQRRIAEVLQLNENEMELISSLRQERGHYSEALLLAGDNRSVIAIESTPLEYWLATTDPRDLSKIDEMKSQNASLHNIEILKALAVKFPHGVSVGGGSK